MSNQSNNTLPTNLNLLAIEQNWQIIYEKANRTNTKLIERPTSELVILSKNHEQNIVTRILKKWLSLKAKQYLTPLLHNCSETTNLTYSSVNFRNQKTIWGSCSSLKKISLNIHLLFLPTNLVKHVLLHELCHTVHMNHSAKFWQLLRMFDSNCEQHKLELRNAGKLYAHTI
jgi:predicted metal-dependent hydrolase